MELGLRDRVAIVTGSGRGIGRATALGLAREGCRVVVTARHEEELRKVVEEVRDLGSEALPIAQDLTEAEAIRRMVEETASHFGRIDILVNNLGGGLGSGVVDTPDLQFQETLNLNLFPALRASRAVVPYMKQQGAGAIVNIASIWGREAGGVTAYNVAKAGVISLAKQMSRELAPFRIRANSVAPGSILFPGGGWDRRMKADPAGMAEFAHREMPLGWGNPEQVADVVVFLVSDRASHVSGACWVVDGGQSRSNI